MTIDTEGSELSLALDFPWDEFDIRIVQIEQLDERKYAAQKGRKQKSFDTWKAKGTSSYPCMPSTCTIRMT
eukprot:scaffold114_cov175-Amphora_coffeaeformis.AAC.8